MGSDFNLMIAMYREIPAVASIESHRRANEVAVGAGRLEEATFRRITAGWNREINGGEGGDGSQRLTSARPDLMIEAGSGTPGPKKVV